MKRSGRYCSSECRNNVGRPDNVTDGMIEEDCSICGKQFEYSKLETGVVCSSGCAKKMSNKILVADTSNCENCGTTFVYNSNRRSRVYCSSMCRQIHRSSDVNRRSEKYRSYKNDFVECECCDANADLEVHHIVPVRFDESLIDDETNLIALCTRCHVAVDEHRRESFDMGEPEKQWRLNRFKDYTEHARAELMNETDDLKIIKFLLYEK